MLNVNIRKSMLKKSHIFKSVFKYDKELFFNKRRIYLLLNYFNVKSCRIKNKKTKKNCTFLFKRKDFYIIMHIYINNKLIYVTNFEQLLRKYKFFKIYDVFCLKLIKKLFTFLSRFDKILFAFQIRKMVLRRRKRINRFKKKLVEQKKIKSKFTKTIFPKYIILKMVLYSIFLGKNVKVKYLFNRSHSLVKEKLKKKRRK